METKLTSLIFKSEDFEYFKEISGENIFACYQCGNCSAGCPAADFMDIAPHEIIRLLQLGQIDEILKANTIWICASCVTCRVRCPKGVDLSKIMEGLRQLVLRNKENYVELNKIENELREKLPQIALVGNFRKFTL